MFNKYKSISLIIIRISYLFIAIIYNNGHTDINMMHRTNNIHVKYKTIYLHTVDDDGADKGMRDVMKTFTF